MDKQYEENVQITEELDQGNELNISENVITSIVGLVTKEVKGISRLHGGISFGEIFGKKNDGKGVKTIISGSRLIVDISLVIEANAIIPEVASEVKTKVKRAIESMTGYNVLQVNIFVEGIVC